MLLLPDFLKNKFLLTKQFVDWKKIKNSEFTNYILTYLIKRYHKVTIHVNIKLTSKCRVLKNASKAENAHVCVPLTSFWFYPYSFVAGLMFEKKKLTNWVLTLYN